MAARRCEEGICIYGGTGGKERRWSSGTSRGMRVHLERIRPKSDGLPGHVHTMSVADAVREAHNKCIWRSSVLVTLL